MIPASVRIMVCLEPTDMRQGFDRLAQKARDRLCGRRPRGHRQPGYALNQQDALRDTNAE